MRTLKTFEAASSSKLATLPSPAPPATIPSFSTPAAVAQKSPWHSPVPYLFGGLAAMLGLIAFALLLLACSYWRLSGNANGDENGERDAEQGRDGKSDNAPTVKIMPIFEEKIVVIMAGDVKPTFLATPMSSRASSFGDGVMKNENFGKGTEEIVEKPKVEVADNDHEEVADNDHEDDQINRSQASAQDSQEQN